MRCCHIKNSMSNGILLLGNRRWAGQSEKKNVLNTIRSMCINGSYAHAQLVMDQVITMLGALPLVVVVMVQAKSDIETKIKKMSTYNSVWESATLTRLKPLVRTQVGAKQVVAYKYKVGYSSKPLGARAIHMYASW